VVVTSDCQKRRKIQQQADTKLAKATSFTGYAASQGDSGGEGSSTACAGIKERHRRRQEQFT
jgi:hypothetical protein